MTNEQYRIFERIVRYGKLPLVLEELKDYDYLSLQEAVGPGMIEFSDSNMDENTMLTLSNEAMELYENRKRQNFDAYFTRAIAIWGAITGTAALVSEILMRFLQQSPT